MFNSMESAQYGAEEQSNEYLIQVAVILKQMVVDCNFSNPMALVSARMQPERARKDDLQLSCPLQDPPAM